MSLPKYIRRESGVVYELIATIPPKKFIRKGELVYKFVEREASVKTAKNEETTGHQGEKGEGAAECKEWCDAHYDRPCNCEDDKPDDRYKKYYANSGEVALVKTAQSGMSLSYDEAAKMVAVMPYDDLYERNIDFIGESGGEAYRQALEEGASEEEAEEMEMKGQEMAESELYDAWASDVEKEIGLGADILYLDVDQTDAGFEFSSYDWEASAERLYQTLMGTGLVGWTSYDEFLEEGNGDPEATVLELWKSGLSTVKEVWGS